MNFVKVILVFGFIFVGESFEKKTVLRSLFILNRHGDRTPTNYLSSVCLNGNKTAYDLDKHVDGLAQLTNKGKKRMFELGLYLREMYGSFWGDKKNRVEVKSSLDDRCIVSAQLLVNGIFRSDIKSVPIHTPKESYDNMLHSSPHCQMENKIRDQWYSEVEKKLTKDHKVFCHYLIDNCGIKTCNLRDISHIDDILLKFNNTNLLPKWATKELLDKIHKIKITKFKFPSSSREIQKIETGLFFNDMMEKIENGIHLANDDQMSIKKAYIYSTHDTFLNALFASLGIDNTLPPPYSSTVIFELYEHEKPNDSLSSNWKTEWDVNSSVKIYFYNKTDDEPFKEALFELKVPGCLETDLCTVRLFKKQIKDLILNEDQWRKACGLRSLKIGSDRVKKTNISKS